MTFCVYCDRPTALFEFGSPTDVARLLCLDHIKIQKRAKEAKARKEARELAKVTCTRCGAPGLLYASGVWCREHAPKTTWPLRAKNEKKPDAISEFSPALAPEEEPVLRAVTCPPDKIPASLKSALKTADAHGWEYHVTYAIGPEPECLQSVKASFRKSIGLINSGVVGLIQNYQYVSTQHEMKPGAKSFTFAKGYGQLTVLQWPVKLGWRDACRFLAGEVPLALDDRPALLDAMSLVCEALNADIVKVMEIR